jgi:hypothetical protein
MSDWITQYNERWSRQELQKVGLRMMRAGVKRATADKSGQQTYRVVSDARLTMDQLRQFLYEGGAR